MLASGTEQHVTHHEQVLTGLQALALGPCLGQVQARVQGSWPVADLQAERRGVTCWDPTISCQLSYVTTT